LQLAGILLQLAGILLQLAGILLQLAGILLQLAGILFFCNWLVFYLQLAGILFATGWYSIEKKVNKIKGLSLWITRLLLLLLLLRVEEEKRKEKSNSISFFRYFVFSLIKKGHLIRVKCPFQIVQAHTLFFVYALLYQKTPAKADVLCYKFSLK
jgi:hypothetical protein